MTRTSTPPAATTNDRPGRWVTSHAMRPRASTSFTADAVRSPTSTRERGSSFRLEPSTSVTDSASAAVSSCAPSHADPETAATCVSVIVVRARTTKIAAAAATHRPAPAHAQPRPRRRPRRSDTRPHRRSTRASERSTRHVLRQPVTTFAIVQGTPPPFSNAFSPSTTKAPSGARCRAPPARPPAAAPARCAPPPASCR